MTPEEIDRFAEALIEAKKTRRAATALTDQFDGADIEDAYQVSEAFTQKSLEMGKELAGWKIALTAAALQEMLSLKEPAMGRIFRSAIFEDVELSFGTLLAPRLELEVAIFLKEDLTEERLEGGDILSAVESVALGFEVADSRTGWKLTGPDLVADNAVAGMFKWGEKILPSSIDFEGATAKLYNGDALQAEGNAGAVMGSPIKALNWLAETALKRGDLLKAGEVIMTGSMIPLQEIKPGDKFRAECDGFAPLGLEITT